LIRPDLDIWKPGEHNGTFRGNNHAFVTATAALRRFWASAEFAAEVRRKAEILSKRFGEICARYGKGRLNLKGRGMMQGVDCASGKIANAVSQAAFKRGLLIETGGSHDQVLKCLCPLVITDEELAQGLDIIEKSVAEIVSERAKTPFAVTT